MKKIILAGFVLASLSQPFWTSPAAAQSAGQASVISTCGTASYPAGTNRPITQDATGVQCTSAGGGGGSNAAAGPTGSAVPASGSYNALNVGGTLRGQTGVNPSGSVEAAQTDLTSVNGVTTQTGAGATGTGTQRVGVAQDTTTIAGSAPGTAGTPSANVVTVQGSASMTPVANNQTQINGTTLLAGTGAQGAGAQRVTVATDTATIAGSAPTTVLLAQPQAGTTGGMSMFYLTAANSTNATNVKNAAGTLYDVELSNNSATPAYVSFYNNAGTPTCGTGIVWQAMIPANSTSGAGWVSDSNVGKAFSTGIAICATTGIAGTGSVAASAYTISIGYK